LLYHEYEHTTGNVNVVFIKTYTGDVITSQMEENYIMLSIIQDNHT